MYCFSCGKDIEEGVSFCRFCGKRVADTTKNETSVSDNKKSSINNKDTSSNEERYTKRRENSFAVAGTVREPVVKDRASNQTKSVSHHVASGAYVPKNQIQRDRHYVPSNPVRDSLWVNVIGIIGSIFLAISMFVPFYSVKAWGETKSISYFSGNKETAIFVLIASIAGIVLAYVDSKETKIAFAAYAAIITLFLYSENKGVSDFFDCAVGYYMMILSLIAILVAGVAMIVYMVSDSKSETGRSIQVASRKPAEEFNRPLRQDEWRCTCGRINPNYTGTCYCGSKKHQARASQAGGSSEKALNGNEKTVLTSSENNGKLDETDKIKYLKEYKELLDNGVITKEEFDEKKKNLL